MKAIIIRDHGKNETKGSLIVYNKLDCKFKCKTLELPDLGNQRNISCIPSGIYDCEKIISPTKGKCFLIKDVPGRDSIEIHKGNYVAGNKIDSKGCILVGDSFTDINQDGFIDISGSTVTLDALLLLLPDKFKLAIL